MGMPQEHHHPHYYYLFSFYYYYYYYYDVILLLFNSSTEEIETRKVLCNKKSKPQQIRRSWYNQIDRQYSFSFFFLKKKPPIFPAPSIIASYHFGYIKSSTFLAYPTFVHIHSYLASWHCIGTKGACLVPPALKTKGQGECSMA